MTRKDIKRKEFEVHELWKYFINLFKTKSHSVNPRKMSRCSQHLEKEKSLQCCCLTWNTSVKVWKESTENICSVLREQKERMIDWEICNLVNRGTKARLTCSLPALQEGRSSNAERQRAKETFSSNTLSWFKKQCCIVRCTVWKI